MKDDVVDPVREMMTAEEIMAKTKFSRTSLFRLERDGFFPKGHPVMPHLKLWFKDEVVAWQKALQDPTSELAQAMERRAQQPPRVPKGRVK